MIVDGGLGLELANRGFRFSTKLWSGEAIVSAPELLVDIHRSYLAAGAQVIESATYQLSHATLRELGYDDAAIDGVFARGIELARTAIAAHRDRTGTREKIIVAASLGPYGATVGDGSEYSAIQHLGRDALYAFHAERTRAVIRANPDVVLFETIPSLVEAVVVAEVARDLRLDRTWISLCCRDGIRTFAGDEITIVADLLDAFECVEVIGINCTAPAAVAPLVRAVGSVTAKPIMVCANLGQEWDSEKRRLAGGASAAEFLTGAREWLDLGVAHVGGCCGVGPSTVAEIAALVG